jgi:hypothetical protein
MPRYLDDSGLERFEAALTSVGVPITRCWAPGLTDAEIDALAASVNLTLPEEARRWWRWHNGVVEGTRPQDTQLVPGRPLLDLAMVLEDFGAGRDVTQDVHRRSALLQPLPDQPWLFFDCDVSHDAPVPILVGGPGADIRPGLDSIGELVATWTALIETGAFAGDHTGWTWDTERIPPEIRAIGIF